MFNLYVLSNFLLKEARKLQTLEDYLNNYSNKGYIFRLTDTPELTSPNPKYKYDTPAGLYFFPLDSEHIDSLLNKSLFASKKKYIVIYKLKDHSKLLKLSTYSSEDLKRDLKALSEAGYIGENYQELKEDYRYDFDIDNCEAPFNFLMYILINQEKSSRAAKALMFLGYDGIFDDDTASFTSDISSQIWVPSSSNVEPIATVKNSNIISNPIEEPSEQIDNKLELARDKNTKPEVLQTLMNDSDSEIKNEALISYLEVKKPWKLLNIKDKNFQLIFLKRLLRKNDGDSIMMLVDSPFTHNDIYEYLFDYADSSNNEWLKTLLAGSSRLPSNIQNKLEEQGYMTKRNYGTTNI